MKEGPTIFLANADDTSGEIEANPPWHEEGAYTGGNVVLYESVCYRAKWWTRGDAPTSAGSPWEVVDCGASEAVVDPNQIPSDETASVGSSDGKRVKAAAALMPMRAISLTATPVAALVRLRRNRKNRGKKAVSRRLHRMRYPNGPLKAFTLRVPSSSTMALAIRRIGGPRAISPCPQKNSATSGTRLGKK